MTRKVLYHGTARANLPGILKKGLIPRGGIGADKWAEDHADRIALGNAIEDMNHPDRLKSVFVSTRKFSASYFAKAAAQETNSEPCVLRIEIPPEHEMNLIQDEQSDPDSRIVAMRYVGTIPAAWIKPVPLSHNYNEPHGY